MIKRFLIAEYIPDIVVPITVFHGDQDKAADVKNSIRLKPMLKPDDKIIILEGEGHGDFTSNDQYIFELREILK